MKPTNKKPIRQFVLEKYNSRCAYCGCEINIKSLSIDHIEPKFRGYTNEQLARYNRVKGLCNIDNFNPCCKSCNSSKSTYTIETWRKEILSKHKRLLRDSSAYRLLFRFNMININNTVKFYFERFEK